MNTKNHKINIHTPDPGYEPFPVSIINRSTYEAMTFDPSLGKPATISYGLNKGGCIRIRLTCRGQESLVIRTLQDWTNQDFGAPRRNGNWPEKFSDMPIPGTAQKMRGQLENRFLRLSNDAMCAVISEYLTSGSFREIPDRINPTEERACRNRCF